MSTTTANLGLVKPDQGEQYNVDIFNANNDAIDTAVGNLQADTTTTPAGSAVASTDTDNTKFAVQFAQGIKMGNLAQLDIRVRRTGATITAGNTGNVAMFTLPAGWRPILASGLMTTGFGGMMSASITSDGTVTLAALGNDWPNAADISFQAIFLVP